MNTPELDPPAIQHPRANLQACRLPAKASKFPQVVQGLIVSGSTQNGRNPHGSCEVHRSAVEPLPLVLIHKNRCQEAATWQKRFISVSDAEFHGPALEGPSDHADAHHAAVDLSRGDTATLCRFQPDGQSQYAHY